MGTSRVSTVFLWLSRFLNMLQNYLGICVFSTLANSKAVEEMPEASDNQNSALSIQLLLVA